MIRSCRGSVGSIPLGVSVYGRARSRPLDAQCRGPTSACPPHLSLFQPRTRLWRNVSQYGAWSLPLKAASISLIGSFRSSRKPAMERFGLLARRNGKGGRSVSRRRPTTHSNSRGVMQMLAREKLAEARPISFAKAWIFGAAINLAAPAITLSQVVSSLPRTGFYATKATSFPIKSLIFYFIPTTRFMPGSC